VAGVAVRAAFQVILVLGLRLPEIASGREFGHDLSRPQPWGLDVGDGVLGDAALFLARVENRRPVACASVVSLPVGRRRVVDLEEELQQVAEARLTRVERDLDRFRVRAVVAVRGVLDVAARVADPRRDDDQQTGFGRHGGRGRDLQKANRAER